MRIQEKLGTKRIDSIEEQLGTKQYQMQSDFQAFGM
jgi:hypothetical protein